MHVAQEAERATRLLVRHVLFHQREKPDQPMRSTELVNLVKESLPKGTSAGVIAQAQALLIRELGLELKKIELAMGRGSTSTSMTCAVVPGHSLRTELWRQNAVAFA